MNRPALSVVIATHNAEAVVAGCLSALGAQADGIDTEIIVADSSTDRTPQIVRDVPTVKLLHFDEPLTVPQLRGRGIAAARGDVIAILDPFALVAETWARELLDAHRRQTNQVIGGSVDLFDAARRTTAEWALYINEYGLFMPPVRAGAAGIVPGCNVSYKRAALFDGDRPRFAVFWKTFVNWDIEAAGSRPWLAPTAVVRLWKPIPFGDFLWTRFDHGRCFGGMRAATWSRWRRALQAAFCLPLPFVMVWRWGRVFWAKGRYRRKLALTTPLQLALFGVWAAGECWGYLAGPGRSCRRLFY